MNRIISKVMVAAVGVSALWAVARAQEEQVPPAGVPAPVLNAVKTRFPGAKLTGAEKEVEDGKTLYEINLRYREKKIDVTITPEGGIVEVEKEIPAGDLPGAVTRTLEDRYPKAVYKTIEKVVEEKKGGETTFYEVLLVTAEGKRWEVQVEPGGKILNEEKKDGDEDEEKDRKEETGMAPERAPESLGALTGRLKGQARKYTDLLRHGLTRKNAGMALKTHRRSIEETFLNYVEGQYGNPAMGYGNDTIIDLLFEHGWRNRSLKETAEFPLKQMYRLTVPDSLDTELPSVLKRFAGDTPSRTGKEGMASAPGRQPSGFGFVQSAFLAQPQAGSVGMGDGIMVRSNYEGGDHAYHFLMSNSSGSAGGLFKDFNVFATRMTSHRRLDYGYGVFHLNGDFYDRRDGAFSERRAGALFLVTHPVSRHARIEGAVGFIHATRAPTPLHDARNAELISHSVAYAKDTAVWGRLGPVDGARYKIGATQLTDIGRGASYGTTLQADYRRYFRLNHRLTYATRGVSVAGFGKAPVVRFGGSWDFRGYPFRSLAGARMFLVSQELRFPLPGPSRLGVPLGPVKFSGVQGAVFLDAGNAWNSGFGPVLGSFGAGLRLGFGGPLILRFDVSKRMADNFRSVRRGTHFQFFLGPNF